MEIIDQICLNGVYVRVVQLRNGAYRAQLRMPNAGWRVSGPECKTMDHAYYWAFQAIKHSAVTIAKCLVSHE